MTRAPTLASATAMARPNPCAAPVTMAVLSARSIRMDWSLEG